MVGQVGGGPGVAAVLLNSSNQVDKERLALALSQAGWLVESGPQYDNPGWGSSAVPPFVQPNPAWQSIRTKKIHI